MTSMTLDTLPTHGVIRAYLTATAVKFAEDGSGAESEENGWVDYDYSLTELFESRNDVRPAGEFNLSTGGSEVLRCWDDEITPEQWARNVLSETLGSAEHDEGSHTFYGSDEIFSDATLTDPRTFSYALHFHVKHCDPVRGWVEDDLSLTF